MIYQNQQFVCRYGAVAMCTLALLVSPVCGMPVQVSGAETATAVESVKTNDAPSDVDDDPMQLRTLPEEAQDIGVDSHVGEVINGDIMFRDSDNNIVRIADLLDGQRPLMMSFNYSDCPKLCSVQLENMTMTLREVDFEVGKDFDFVSISIDPTEQSIRARENKEKYLHLYNRRQSAIGWHFLTGDREQIANITDQVGFRFKYVREQKLYSHPPVFVLFSPEGKIVRYIHGLDFDPKTIRLALIEAAAGKIGSPINYFSYGLGCFSYNDSTGEYTFQAIAMMRIGGLITVLGLLATLGPYWFLRRHASGSDDQAHLKDDPTVEP